MARPDLCPNCGHSVRSHTGSYCHRCGEPLREERPLPKPQPDERPLREAVKLSVPQREAIRDLHEHPVRPSMVPSIAPQTIRALRRRGLVEEVGYKLTSLGVRAYRGIMESGDGPEELKSMLNPHMGR